MLEHCEARLCLEDMILVSPLSLDKVFILIKFDKAWSVIVEVKNRKIRYPDFLRR